MGVYASASFDPNGRMIDRAAWDRRAGEWLPGPADERYVMSLMRPVYERGTMAGWIAPPARGVNGKPVDFEYVRMGWPGSALRNR